MSSLHANFCAVEDAQAATQALRDAGFRAESIEVLSPVPFEHHDFGTDTRPSAIPWLTLLGGLSGFSLGLAMVWFTAHDFPIYTGGMSLVPAWSTGVVVYETTMLGAILAAVVALFLEAGLVGGGGAPAPTLAEDELLTVRLELDDEAGKEQALSLLQEHGGRV